MTDEQWESLRQATRWSRNDEADILGELDRARRVEHEQAESINALADALWAARQYGDQRGDLCWCMSPCDPIKRRPTCINAENALRLAGRLP
jgi:hypothetical protein